MTLEKKNKSAILKAESVEVVAKSDNLITVSDIEKMIVTVRGVQVIVDRDLAMLYGVETKRLNEQVRRNINRFPEHFRFQLTEEEKNELVANCDLLLKIKYFQSLPYVFTEQGVAMLATVTRQLNIDIQRHNAQYRPISVTSFDRCHDRFLCIDDTVYHIGASLKDLGKKWFAFSKMELSVTDLLNKVL